MLVVLPGASNQGGAIGGFGTQPTLTWDDLKAMRDEVPIAGVPWPLYKLVALAVAAVVLVAVGIITASAAPAVLTAAAAGTAVWLGVGATRSRR